MELYTSYLRVSTVSQGQSGLGIDSQKSIINNYLKCILPVNEFIDIETNRIFTANYEKYPTKTDSVYAPRRVNIDIVAEKKVSLKIDYVRVEKNVPQKISINIPPKYDPIPVKKQ